MCDDINIFVRYIYNKCLECCIDKDDKDDNYISLDREVIEEYDKPINIELSPYCNDKYDTRNIVIIIDKEDKDKDKNLTFLKHRNSPKYYIKEDEDDDFIIINYNYL